MKPGNTRAAKQLAGQCVYSGCTAPAIGDDECPEHHALSKERKRQSATRRRSRLRAAGRCIDCAAKTALLRCSKCYRAWSASRLARRVDKPPRRVDNSDGSSTEKRGHYKTESFADGSARARYVGLSHRGGPTRAEVDRSLVRLLTDARGLLDGFVTVFPGIRDELDALPRIQRTEAWDLLVSRLTRSARLQLEVAGALSKAWRENCAGCGRPAAEGDED